MIVGNTYRVIATDDGTTIEVRAETSRKWARVPGTYDRISSALREVALIEDETGGTFYQLAVADKRTS